MQGSPIRRFLLRLRLRRGLDPLLVDLGWKGDLESGVLAPNAADRKQIVPGPSEEGHSASGHEEESAERRTYRLSWCVLLGRVFQVDVTVCPDCGGSMKIIAALTEATSIRNYLLGVGLPVKAHFQLKQSQARVNVSARHRELFNTELGLYGLPEHRQMTVTFDPTQTWFDVEQCRGYPTVAL